MTVIGSYEVVRLIAEGGFGRTYEGRHVHNKKLKACLKQNINLSDEDAKLLEEEVSLLWDVHHHSLPVMRDFYRLKDGSRVLAMSYIEGKTLDAAVTKRTAIHPEDVAWMTERSLKVLAYLHGKGIIHCDVKPPNIIVKPQEHDIALIDYGLASLRPTRASRAPGYTALFAAPELVNGKPPLPEADLYSLGLTMLYALGGDPAAKTFPEHVPKQLQEFYSDLIRYDPLERPNWEKQDLITRISDIRLAAFGRRHTSG
jgi:serine/threonine-protein kinase